RTENDRATDRRGAEIQRKDSDDPGIDQADDQAGRPLRRSRPRRTRAKHPTLAVPNTEDPVIDKPNGHSRDRGGDDRQIVDAQIHSHEPIPFLSVVSLHELRETARCLRLRRLSEVYRKELATNLGPAAALDDRRAA